MPWIVAVLCLLLTLPALLEGCELPGVGIVVAMDSTKHTNPKDFTEEKEIVRKVLKDVKIDYALVVYTGQNASIYKTFGEDTSVDGSSLEKLDRIHSKAPGFAFTSLFNLRYKRVPDCLWLLRNNENYTYPKRKLSKNPMGYDQQIPKIALNFGYPNLATQMQTLTRFEDIQYNGRKIKESNKADQVDNIKKAICQHCKKPAPSTVQPSLPVKIPTSNKAATATTQYIHPTWTVKTPTITQTDYKTVQPSTLFQTLATSSKEEASNTMIKEYQDFLAYNITDETLTNEDEIRKYVGMSSRLLSKSEALQANIQPNNGSIGFHVLGNLEKFCVSVGKKMAAKGITNTTLQVQTKYLKVGISTVNISSFKGLAFGDMDVDLGFLRLPPVIFNQQEQKSPGVVVFMMLEPFPFFTDRNRANNVTLAGKIISVIAIPHPTKVFDPPVTLRVQHKVTKEEAQPSCVFWDFKKRSWSNVGCRVTDGNASITECQCDHMTHYAVLLSFNDKVTAEKHHQAMTTITYVGCSLSIVGVFLTFVVFLCLPVLKSERTRIHCNLCVAVGSSQILFLAAGSKDLVEETVACKFYASLMFYWFLSVFTWMLVEGVHLYQMIIIAFISRSMMKFYYAIGWGLPAVIVIIVSSIMHKGYGTNDFCWMSSQDGTLWAFAVPVLLIIVVNTAVLICILRLRVKLEQSSEVYKTVKTGARVSIVLLPLLGMTWLFGFFSVLPGAGLLFQYLFAITNSLQGFMIFLFHCIGNSEVRSEFHRKTEHWYFVRTLSTNSISMATNRVTPISVNASVNATKDKQKRDI